ncbi:MAG: HAD hydrolase family protein, partial [Desulfocapsaceae bacterium]|nr:HAD hydrolase family protein [Desulfocapsaceae bacterium]
MNNHCPANDPESHLSDCEILEKYRQRSQQRSRQDDSPEYRLLMARAEPVQLLLLDVDGVLTDGSLIYTQDGLEAKAFNTQDGLGVRLLQKIGVEVGLITARRSEIVSRRAEELGMKYIMQGVSRKLDAFKEILARSALKPYQVCYMGDDWIDLALIVRVGLSACPPNSVRELKEICHFVSSRTGGAGGVRDVCDL